MNSIAEDQNKPSQLARLAAQRNLHATAKKIFALQVILTGPIAVMLAIVGLNYPSMKALIGIWSISVVVLDLSFFNQWRKNATERAVRVQELFDCDVLHLPWNQLKAGAKPDPELVKEQSDKYKKWAKSMPALENWYAVSRNDIPMHIARLACQRANCWWDSEQRKRYSDVILIVTVVVVLVIVWIGMVNRLSLDDFVLRAIVPMLPAIILAVRQFSDQKEATGRGEKLKEHAEKLWEQALSGALPDELTKSSRSLQDEIFERRKRNPVVFDWIFKRLHRTLNTQMEHGCGDYFDEAAKRLGIVIQHVLSGRGSLPPANSSATTPPDVQRHELANPLSEIRSPSDS